MDIFDAILKGPPQRAASHAAVPKIPEVRRASGGGTASCPSSSKKGPSSTSAIRGAENGRLDRGSTRKETLSLKSEDARRRDQKLAALQQEQTRLRKLLRTFNRQGPLNAEAGKSLQQNIRLLSQIDEAVSCLKEGRPCSETVEASLLGKASSSSSATDTSLSGTAPNPPITSSPSFAASEGGSFVRGGSTAQRVGGKDGDARVEGEEPKTPSEVLLWQLRRRQEELLRQRRREEEDRTRLANCKKGAVRRAASFRLPVAGEAGSDPHGGGGGGTRTSSKTCTSVVSSSSSSSSGMAVSSSQKTSLTSRMEAFRRHSQAASRRSEPSLILHDCSSSRGDAMIPCFRLPRERPAEDCRGEGCLVGRALDKVKAQQVAEARKPPSDTPTLIQQLEALKRKLNLDASRDLQETVLANPPPVWRPSTASSFDGAAFAPSSSPTTMATPPKECLSTEGGPAQRPATQQDASAAPRFLLKETKPGDGKENAGAGTGFSATCSSSSRKKKAAKSPVVSAPSKASAAAAGNKALLIERRRRQLLMKALLREKERMEQQQKMQIQRCQTPVFEITPPRSMHGLPRSLGSGGGAKADLSSDVKSAKESSLERRKRELEAWERRLLQRERRLMQRSRAAVASEGSEEEEESPRSFSSTRPTKPRNVPASSGVPSSRTSPKDELPRPPRRGGFTPDARARLPCVAPMNFRKSQHFQGSSSSSRARHNVALLSGDNRRKSCATKANSPDEGLSEEESLASLEESAGDDSLDDFIADSSEEDGDEAGDGGSGVCANEDKKDWRTEIQRVTGYDPSAAKFKERDRERLVESSFAFMDEEERRSRKVAAKEDYREWLLEQAALQSKKRRA